MLRHGAYAAMLLFVLVGCLPLHRVYGLTVLRQPRRLLLAVLPVAVVFAAWDVAATAAGHWRFDPDQTMAVRDRRPAPGGVRLLRGHPARRDPHLRGGGSRAGAPPSPHRRAVVTYTAAAVLGVVVAVARRPGRAAHPAAGHEPLVDGLRDRGVLPAAHATAG